MNDKKELERHNKILEQIKNAKTREELPKLTYGTISSYLATNVYFDNTKLSAMEFTNIVNKIVEHGMFIHPDTKEFFIKEISQKYPNVKEEEIIKKYESILNTRRIDYILNEIGQRNIKLDEIVKKENLNLHNDIESGKLKDEEPNIMTEYEEKFMVNGPIYKMKVHF